MNAKQACIIGSGSSGITAVKTLKEHGIEFDCFEKGSFIGGIWRYNNDNQMSSAYHSLHINTNKYAMAYSDFPMPSDYPMFPHHTQIYQYFEDYVEHFGIRPYIQFNTEVLDVKRLENGNYQVVTNKGTGVYQAVIIANGHHWNPRYPNFPGEFTGETLHSHYYRVPNQILNKDLLIVGIGNSAVDIACEAARLHAGKVVISTRSSAHIMPNWLWDIPMDSLANPIFGNLPVKLQSIIMQISLLLARGRQRKYGVPVPSYPVLHEHPTISQDLLNLTARGLIKFKPNIKEIRGKTVIFADGSTQYFDMIIYATGYKITFPFFKNIAFQVSENNEFRLYKKVIHPDYPNLFFVGLIQPLGSIMPLAEIQSKWIAKILKGEVQLPSRETMLKSIEEDKQKMMKRYNFSPRHTLQVDFHPYKKSIESEIKRMSVNKRVSAPSV
ncbi:monooxygenase [Calothrix sp. HK-06]|nr:monooxygenase [Calothrix sp. HK-06]